MIRVENASLVYDNGTEALKGVSVSVVPGDFTAIMGPNGSGKTSLLNIMSAGLKPTSGSVFLNGKPLSSISHVELARQIGFLPQGIRVDFPFTVREIVMMGRYPHIGYTGRERKEDRNIAESAMEMAGVLHLSDRLLYQLSGGERQRVFLAQALTVRPRLLILDEPVANLDIKYKLGIMELLTKLNREEGLTVILTIHDLDMACKYPDKIIFIKDGSVAGAGPKTLMMTPENIERIFEVQTTLIEAEGRCLMAV